MQFCEKHGVWFYRSSLLPCPHGFSTRIGGVSTAGHTKTMNLAFGRGDSEEIVLRNLERFSHAVGISPCTVISLPQVHGNHVLYVSQDDAGDGYHIQSGRAADGYYTDDNRVAVGVKTADCVPILLCGLAENGTPAVVAALHAGWRGTYLKIAELGVKAMISKGIPCSRIRAAIGPSIGSCCYEVDSDFRKKFRDAFFDELIRDTFFEKHGCSGKYMADLKEINRRILMNTGVPSSNIDVSELCTFCHPELFYSHRYSHGVRGTMLSVISLPFDKPSDSSDES